MKQQHEVDIMARSAASDVGVCDDELDTHFPLKSHINKNDSFNDLI